MSTETKVTYGDKVFDLAREFVLDATNSQGNSHAQNMEEAHSLARAIQAAIDTWFEDNKV